MKEPKCETVPLLLWSGLFWSCGGCLAEIASVAVRSLCPCCWGSGVNPGFKSWIINVRQGRHLIRNAPLRCWKDWEITAFLFALVEAVSVFSWWKPVFRDFGTVAKLVHILIFSSEARAENKLVFFWAGNCLRFCCSWWNALQFGEGGDAWVNWLFQVCKYWNLR